MKKTIVISFGLASSIVLLLAIYFSMNISFITGVGVFILLINGGLLAFSKEISDKIHALSWIHKIEFKIPAAIFVIISLFLVNYKKGEINSLKTQKEQSKKDSLSAHTQYLQDSSYKAYFSEYSLKSQKQLTEVMAKYGLKYDSARKKIERLVSDSMKSLPDPEFDFCDDGILLDSVKNNICFLKLEFCEWKAPSTSINLSLNF